MAVGITRVWMHGRTLFCSLPSAIVRDSSLGVGDGLVLRTEGNLIVMERVPVEQFARRTGQQNNVGLEELSTEGQSQMISTSEPSPKQQSDVDKRILMERRLRAIRKVVADEFCLRTADLNARSNTQKLVFPRQVAMFLSRELAGASLPEIGRTFGGKHHTTVLHSVEKIRERRKSDKNLDRLINKLNGVVDKSVNKPVDRLWKYEEN